MKRTIKEVYDIIKEKQKNSENDAHFSAFDPAKQMRLQGERNAYQDVLCLIESSHLLEEDKPIKGSGLEALEDIRKGLPDNMQFALATKMELSIIEKELKEGLVNKKALEIIKENFVFLEPALIAVDSDEMAYGSFTQNKHLTKEECELLKEVLL